MRLCGEGQLKGGEDGSKKDCEMVSIESASDDEVDAKVYAGGGEASRHNVVKSN